MSSTNFTVPRGVKKIDCFCVGGGGSGGCGDPSGIEFGVYTGSGGGGGYTKTVLEAGVTSGQKITVIVGAGGYNGVSSGFISSSGSEGSASSIGSICSANGGGYGGNGGAGGSGGGGIGSLYEEGHGVNINGGNGGSDGGDGTYNGNKYLLTGIGQHSTTRYFGERNGTLYAGGGGGGGRNGTEGSGGAGGGGNGSNTWITSNGSATTGGGGGGTTNSTSANGGSGICIIRWGDQKS